jgi:hypothetical protein
VKIVAMISLPDNLISSIFLDNISKASLLLAAGSMITLSPPGTPKT